MSQYIDGPTKTFQVDEALAPHTRVRMASDGDLDYADAGDVADGTTMSEAYAAGDKVAVRLRTAGGTHKCTASAAITAGDFVYGAADGKVSGDCAGELFGKALEAATADGDIIEVLVYGAGSAFGSTLDVGTVAAAGSAQGDATAIVNQVTYVSGADDAKGVVLPTAVAGLTLYIYNTHATAGLLIYPASGADFDDGSADANLDVEGKTLTSCVALDATTWATINYTTNT